jgi:DNA replication protein DnaC
MEQISNLTDRISRILSLTSHSTQPVKYECELCKDTEWIINTETNSAKPCKCQEAKRYRLILENCGISEAFLKKNFSNYTPKNAAQREAKETAQAYAKNFETIRNERNNSIAFLKQVGSGKTHLSIAICNTLMEQGTGVRYMQYREVITRLKQNMTDEAYYQNEMHKYKECPVLLIDDLYKGKTTESDINLVYEIINHRYLKGMPIILSCEYDMDKLLEFDEAIGSRIAEMCKGRIIEFIGIELNDRLR